MTKSITTKGGSSHPVDKKKKSNYLRKCIRRKNCIYCFVFNVVFALAAVGAITILSFKYVRIKQYIHDAKDRADNLKNRMDIDAFFHQGKCKIYADPASVDQLKKVDHTFCNRYCDINYHMEFLYRSVQFKQLENDIEDASKIEQDGTNIAVCPHYVEIRPCQGKRTTSNAKTAECEKKNFVKDYLFEKDPNGITTYMGICTGCEHAASK